MENEYFQRTNECLNECVRRNELLGGGLCSRSAFLFCNVFKVFVLLDVLAKDLYLFHFSICTLPYQYSGLARYAASYSIS